MTTLILLSTSTWTQFIAAYLLRPICSFLNHNRNFSIMHKFKFPQTIQIFRDSQYSLKHTHCLIFKFKQIFCFLFCSIFRIRNISYQLVYGIVFNIIMTDSISQFRIHEDFQKACIVLRIQAKMIS